MVQIPSCLHSTFKEISNEYSHAQIRVKTKKLWPRQVGEEKQVAVRRVCRDQEVCREVCRDKEVCREVCRDRKWCRNRKPVSRPEMLQKLEKGLKLSF